MIFTAEGGEESIEVRYEDETIWASQKMMAALFGVDVRTISEHLKNIFETQELSRDATIRNFRIVQPEGKRSVTRTIEHYNLDAIISVGYRVNSKRATQFRQWATQVLREFAIKGYVLDNKRMENGTFLGEDYFERLLAEIREIRLSERRFYQKITDIYATSLDYNPQAPTVTSLQKSRTNSTLPSTGTLQPNSSGNVPTVKKSTWASPPGRKVLTGKFSGLMLRLPKIVPDLR